MPKTKFAMLRFNALNDCFRSSKHYFMDDLLFACKKAIAAHLDENDPEFIGLSKRTIQGDIKDMKKIYSIPLKQERCYHPDYRRKLDRYFYTDKTFTIGQQPLGEGEKELMVEAISFLSRLSHMKSMNWVRDLVDGLDIWKGQSEVPAEVLLFEESPRLKGIDFLKPLYNAITKETVMKVAYYSFASEKAYEFIVSPYFLKQYNKRWYLFGKANNVNLSNPEALLNLPLDRIKNLEVTTERFIPNTGKKRSEYFDDLLGVTFDWSKKKELIKLRITKKQWHYIESKPFHRSQRIIDSSHVDHVDFSLELIPNYELESAILSRGEQIEVLEPQWFRDSIKDKVEQMFKKYF